MTKKNIIKFSRKIFFVVFLFLAGTGLRPILKNGFQDTTTILYQLGPFIGNFLMASAMFYEIYFAKEKNG